jgi:hypothetical protein
MKATKEQVDEKLLIIKLFSSNYARDLLYMELDKHKAIIQIHKILVSLFLLSLFSIIFEHSFIQFNYMSFVQDITISNSSGRVKKQTRG